MSPMLNYLSPRIVADLIAEDGTNGYLVMKSALVNEDEESSSVMYELFNTKDSIIITTCITDNESSHRRVAVYKNGVILRSGAWLYEVTNAIRERVLQLYAESARREMTEAPTKLEYDSTMFPEVEMLLSGNITAEQQELIYRQNYDGYIVQ